MEIAHLVLEFLKLFLSWPVVVLVVLLVFMCRFEAPISDFLKRMVKAEAYRVKVEASAPQPREQVREAAESQTEADRMRTAAERYIEENPVAVLVEFEQVLNALQFERAFSAIYGSQIALLEHLEERGEHGDKYVNLLPFFRRFTEATKLATAQFQDYIGFLLAFRFVKIGGPPDDLVVSITPFGLTFLGYIRAQYAAAYVAKPN